MTLSQPKAQTPASQPDDSQPAGSQAVADNKSQAATNKTQAAAASVQQDADSQPQASFDKDGISTSLNRTDYNPQNAQAIQLTAKMVVKAGDAVTFTIPKGAYKQPTYQQLTGVGGTTSVSEQGNTYVVTDSFTAAGTYLQTISLQPYSEETYVYTLFSAGKTTIPIVVRKNNQEVGTVSFKQTINPTMQPTFERTALSKYTVGKLSPNVDYQWTLKFNENSGTTAAASKLWGLAKTINHGTTVTIPVPAGFVLNAEESAKLSGGKITWSASQAGGAGGDVTFVNNGGSAGAITLVGHFTNKLTAKDQDVAASQPIKIVQDTGNGKTLTAYGPAFADKLISESEDNPQGVQLSGNVYGAYGLSNDKYPEGDVPLSTNPETIAFWKYTLSNTTAFNANNVLVTITLPDGMKAERLGLPVAYSSGKLTYVIHRYVDAGHPDETTSGVLNPGERTIDFTNLTGNVRSIQMTLENLNSGVGYNATSYSYSNGGFNVYGYVSQKYDNGTAVKVGDKLTSTLKIGQSAQVWQEDQYVVEAKTTPALIDTGSYESNRKSGAQGAGFLRVDWPAPDKDVEFANPTIYYVLPTNANYKDYRFANNKATVTNYKAADGRTVVKVVYQNSTKQDFPANSHDYLLLNNIADLPNGTSDYKIFMVVPTGVQLKGDGETINKVNAQDLQYVENNSDAYLIGQGNWVIESVEGAKNTEQSQGNKNLDLTLNGESDVQGSDQMTFTGAVVNNTKDDLKNISYVLNLPDKADGRSGFNFYLNGPVTVIDSATGQAIAGVKIEYSTSRATLKASAQPSGGDFGTMPADLSTVRAIRVTIPKLTASQIVRVILKGTDPTLINDSGKTAYLSSSIYTSDNSLKPVTILPTMPVASSIKVTGTTIQHAQLTFYDDTAGTDLSSVLQKLGKSGLLTAQGNSGDLISFADANDIVQALEKQHYVFSKVTGQGASDPDNSYNSVKYGHYDTDTTTTQAFVLHFTHGTKTESGSVTRREIIHYFYGPNQALTGTAHEDFRSNGCIFDYHLTTDLVTNKTREYWTPASHTFDAETSPTVAGYKPDKSVVPAQTVTPDKDVVITVYYIANPQKATVKYIDWNTGQILSTKDLTGVSDGHSKYWTKSTIEYYKKQGYKLLTSTKPAPDSTYGKEVIFDHDDNMDQIFVVYLEHEVVPIAPDPTNPNPPQPGQPINPDDPNTDPDHHKPVYPKGIGQNDLTKTITRTIHYVTKDTQGHFTELSDYPAVAQTVKYQAKGYIDKVTGKWVYGPTNLNEVSPQENGLTWTTDNSSFAAVKSPSKNNYHIVDVENDDGSTNWMDTYDQKNIRSVAAYENTKNYDVYVVYAIDQAPAKVIYQDVADPKNVIQIGEDYIGQGDVGSTINYSTTDRLIRFTNQGYVLAKNGFDPEGKKPVYKANEKDNTFSM